MKPGGKLTEALGLAVFALAAGNIMVYTVQSFKATYTRPPLSTWQKGAGQKPGENSTSPNGENKAEEKAKEKKESKGGGAGETLLKVWEALPIPGIKGGFLGGPIG